MVASTFVHILTRLREEQLHCTVNLENVDVIWSSISLFQHYRCLGEDKGKIHPYTYGDITTTRTSRMSTELVACESLVERMYSVEALPQKRAAATIELSAECHSLSGTVGTGQLYI